MTRVSASPVRVEDQAFGDPRIAMLGELAGYNAFEALGRMTHLWRWCTQRQTQVVTEAAVRVMIGPDGVDALIGAELGERVPNGIRVRGTKGRIEWQAELAEKRQAAGEARAARAPRDERGRLRSSKPPAHAGDVLDESPAQDQHPPAQDQRSPAKSSASSSSSSGTSSREHPEGENGEARSRPAPAKPARAKSRSAVPADFVPALVEMPAWFDASAELQRFRDHHTAKGSLMADWNAAWRTWCGNAKRFHVDRGGGGPRAGPPPGSTQIALSVLAQLEAEEAERNRS